MQSIRPSIRAMDMTVGDATLHPWPNLLWDHVLQHTGCVAAPLDSREGGPHTGDIQSVSLKCERLYSSTGTILLVPLA